MVDWPHIPEPHRTELALLEKQIVKLRDDVHAQVREYTAEPPEISAPLIQELALHAEMLERELRWKMDRIFNLFPEPPLD